EGTGIFISDDPTRFEELGTAADKATIKGNTITGFVHAIDVLRKGTATGGPKDLTVTVGGPLAADNNSIVGPRSGVLGSTGVRVLDTNGPSGIGNATVAIQGNNSSIHGFAIGIDVDGGTATIDNDLIFDNGTGIRFTNAGTGSVSNINFDSTTDNGTDL